MDKLAIINRIKRSYKSIRIAGIGPRHASTDDISRCPVCIIDD